MRNVPKIDLGLTGYDELFMNDKERAENKLPKIYDIPLTEIDDFPDHPFQVRLDEDMEQLVESIKERGVITPITLRQKDDGRYEIVSGHRRRKASELAGLETVPAEIKDLSRDEAIILMVESNLQRSVILPSEKAKSYKMKLEAMRRLPGRPSKNNSAPVEQNFGGKTSREVLAENSPDSHAQIQRYIRLNELIPELLDMVDDGKIALRPAVELSYLTEQEQQCLHETIEYADCTPSHAQSRRLRELSESNELGPHVIEVILNEEKPNQREKINIRYDQARRYIPETVPYEKTTDYIMKALEFYQRHRDHDRGDER